MDFGQYVQKPTFMFGDNRNARDWAIEASGRPAAMHRVPGSRHWPVSTLTFTCTSGCSGSSQFGACSRHDRVPGIRALDFYDKGIG
eukprot:COSAG01_NODE_7076_length_3364_cov_9.983767_2_plen_86_part_00